MIAALLLVTSAAEVGGVSIADNLYYFLLILAASP